MKQALLSAMLAAVAASALTLLLNPAPRAEPAGPTAAEFRAILADFSAGLAALRREPPPAAPAPAAAASQAVLVPPPAPGGAPVPAAEAEPVPAAEEVPAMEEFAVREERSAIPRSAELVERLRGLAKWEESAEIRRTWILAPEETVVGAFGKPDEIWIQDGGDEVWSYRTLAGTTDEDGNPEWRDVTMRMNRGRLVFVDD